MASINAGAAVDDMSCEISVSKGIMRSQTWIQSRFMVSLLGMAPGKMAMPVLPLDHHAVNKSLEAHLRRVSESTSRFPDTKKQDCGVGMGSGESFW
jgi:hypothetical protein